MYCIIVGDIVKSKQIDSIIQGELTRTIKDTLNRINTENIDSIMADFGLVRGDAFEGVLLSQYKAPKIIKDIIKAFYRINNTKVRISVVVGQLTTTSSDRNEANGPAFYKAVDDISKMKDSKCDHWLQVSFDTNSIAQPLVNSLFEMLTALTKNWTDKQREVVWLMEDLSGQQSLVAKRLGISTTVVKKQLKAANYLAYSQSWINLENFLISLDSTLISERSQPETSYLPYYNIALEKNKAHKYEEAFQLFMNALALGTEEFGVNSAQLVPIYNGLAENLIEQKRYEQAKEYLTISLKLQEGMPKARFDYARTLTIYGNLFIDQGDYSQALAYFKKAKEIALNSVGENHPLTSECNNNIAKSYRLGNDYKNAIKYYFLDLSYSKEYAESDPIGYADILCNIAYCYNDMNDKKQAEHYANESLNIYESNLAPDHVLIKCTKDLIKKIKWEN